MTTTPSAPAGPRTGPAHAAGVRRADEPAPAPSAADGPGGDVDRDDRDDDLDADAGFGPTTRAIGLVLLVGGLVGAVAAFTLTYEKLQLLTNPNYVPSCSVDPVLSCGTIMRTAQAELFGFPNPLIGLAVFPVVAAMGALVTGRVELPRWCWFALQGGATLGLAFVLWLITESVSVIHALCPYCMVVWVVVIAVFWYVTVHNMATGDLGGGRVSDVLVRRHGVVLAVAYLALVVTVVAAFPAYWASLVGLG